MGLFDIFKKKKVELTEEQLMLKEYFGGKSLIAERLAEMERTSYATWLNGSENNDFEEWANDIISAAE